MRAWIMPPHPQYRVCWGNIISCGACDFKHTETYTTAFFTPERALEEAAWILQSPDRTLIYIEQ